MQLRNMNRKGQTGVIGVIFLFIFFLMFWFIWLGGWVNEVGNMMVTTNSLTGIEAFFYSNLNMVILVCAILGMLGYMYFVSRS